MWSNNIIDAIGQRKITAGNISAMFERSTFIHLGSINKEPSLMIQVAVDTGQIGTGDILKTELESFFDSHIRSGSSDPRNEYPEIVVHEDNKFATFTIKGKEYLEKLADAGVKFPGAEVFQTSRFANPGDGWATRV